MSHLLGINFTKQLKQKFPDEINVQNVKECLEIRHQIIHEMKQISLSKRDVQKYATSIMVFLLDTAIFCSDIVNQIK